MAEPVDPAALGDLQAQLRDLLCLAVAGDHIRWVLTGEQTARARGLSGGAITQWRTWADDTTEYLVRFGVPPDGRIGPSTKTPIH